MPDLKSKLAIASGTAGVLLAAFLTVKDIATNSNFFESDNSQEPIQEEITPMSNENVVNEHGLRLPEND